MDKPKPEKNKPFDYLNEVQAAQKQENPNVSNLVTTLRTDMVPASNVQPAKESPLQRDNLRVAVGILLGLVIVVMILFSLVGPGRPILEQNLALLAHKFATPTLTFTATISPSPLPPTQTPVIPTKTPEPSATPTRQPTKTPVVNFYISPTAVIHTPTSTIPACREATSITIADVGQTICVKGIVIDTIINPTDFMVIFSNKRGAFYWVSYDMVWSKAEINACYQITGKIEQIGTSPMLVFNYGNMPEACP